MEGTGFQLTDDLKIQRALISVTDKTGIVEFARRLAEHGVGIISTGGTLDTLHAAGIPAVAVEAETGFPEILGGRVKTIHPKIAGGMLADKSNPEHMADLQTHKIRPIDMVVCNFYPFEEAATRRDISLADLIEKIDIGGPGMVIAAAKNHGSVVVVTSPGRYADILDELDRTGGKITAATRQQGFIDAVNVVGDYRGAIRDTFNGLAELNGSPVVPARRRLKA